mmetsp:Transcript_29059/g.33216  ORF Transcript_29059/g.33216 Transcript_29059/m.33216 type:complete len:82 (-) Transcript_29059:36-281(-)
MQDTYEKEMRNANRRRVETGAPPPNVGGYHYQNMQQNLVPPQPAYMPPGTDYQRVPRFYDPSLDHGNYAGRNQGNPNYYPR